MRRECCCCCVLEVVVSTADVEGCALAQPSDESSTAPSHSPSPSLGCALFVETALEDIDDDSDEARVVENVDDELTNKESVDMRNFLFPTH